jgi:hypothetical protein
MNNCRKSSGGNRPETSWFSLVLWKMSKTSPIENASQHNEEFKAIVHCRCFAHFLSEIFCSGFGWSLARRVSKSFDFSGLFCSIFFHFRNSSELTTEFPDTPNANQIVYSLKFETKNLKKDLNEISKIGP